MFPENFATTQELLIEEMKSFGESLECSAPYIPSFWLDPFHLQMQRLCQG